MKNAIKNAVVAVLITRENCTASLEKIGNGIEKLEKQSAAIVAFAKESGIDLNDRKAFVGFFVDCAFADKKWTENPTKKGTAAPLDMVRSGGVVKGEVKALVSNTSRHIAKGIYAAWQYIADNAEKSGPADSIKKVMQAQASLNTRLESLAGEDCTDESIKAALVKMGEIVALLTGK